MYKYLFLSAVLLITSFSCSSEVAKEYPLQVALSSDDPLIKRVVDSLDRYEVQIRYTQIDRVKDSVVFTDYDFQVDSENYFYPASSVKFPIAVLALEKLNTIENVDLHNPFYIEGDTVLTTFANDISQIFTVSDNEANNRLFEFLGQDAINKNLEDRGVFPVRIAHRLSAPNSDDITTKPLVIYLNDSSTTMHYPISSQTLKPLHLNGIQKGVGFYKNDSLVKTPFDFSFKNYYPIDAQHSLIKRIFFPEKFQPSERFNLSLEQLDYLRTAMSTLPREMGYPEKEYYDSYVKFFMFGDRKERIPEHIKIHSKVGYAYGTLSECAYITDDKNKVDFLLTATILVNKNGIFNDDTYEFDDIGIPFLAELGRQLYALELQRKKKGA